MLRGHWIIVLGVLFLSVPLWHHGFQAESFQ